MPLQIQQLINYSSHGHNKRVSQISGLLAAKLGYSPSDTSKIIQAAALHDVGKMCIDAAILNKPGKLTPEEFEIVKTHTDIGAGLLMEAAEILDIAITVAMYHHERYDGGSYHGLSGNEIHPVAGIVAASDVFDALISARPYKPPMAVPTIIDYFQSQAGRQFDSDIVAALLSMIQEITPIYKQEAQRV